MNISRQKNGLSGLMEAQNDEGLYTPVSQLNIVPSTLQTRMSVQEFLAWTNKEDTLKTNLNNIEEINTLSYLKMNLTNYSKSLDYNFAFQIRQPILPVGSAALYLVNQSNKNVNVCYKLRCLGKSDNRVSVHSVAEGVYESMDKHSSLYLDDLSMEWLKDSVEEMDKARPIKIPTGKLTIICDILILCNDRSSSTTQQRRSTKNNSVSLILYL